MTGLPDGYERIQYCTECDERVDDPGTAGNGGSFCPVCGHNTDTRDVKVN